MTKKQATILKELALKEASQQPRVIAKASTQDADRARLVSLFGLALLSLSVLLLSLLLLLP